MKTFLDAEFLLDTDTSSELFHEFSRDLPIIDYHNHLIPEQIASNKQFRSITEVWLDGDHYKWRAMRALGIPEDYITGDASDYEKFEKWAETVPHTLRNPLYHWTHLELQRYFGIKELLSPKTAKSIFEKCNHFLQKDEFTTQGLLEMQNVEVVCTTDHPTDSLEHHIAFKGKSDLKMFPTFRPDKFIHIEKDDYLNSIEIADYDISNFDDLLNYLQERINFFDATGCKLADHGIAHFHKPNSNKIDLNALVAKRIDGGFITPDELSFYKARLMHELGVMYYEKGWVAQYHVNAIRDNNTRLSDEIGADVGCDSIGDYSQAESMSYFLNELNKVNKLGKTILYNLNPGDNEVFATMAGNFRNIQYGSAWWFLDQKDGMEKQMNALSNMGLLSTFLGMLTDSRSFLSFPRHEYFRRILCNIIGQDVEKGEIPKDMELLGSMVQNISYFNAKNYFKF
ncbi:glucuronate isomerase [Portibacter lacus]|uniref:Uronate isomerase n=1 Tax=Portibacter lacus TaxID=1099794 RepID=A0AA37SWL1_9BACT|nr:glucuronate isomerase [Portibacter lacus]GLR20031.1 uronate isomerase [Portibacter lacus]